MITIHQYDNFNRSNSENFSKIIFKDTLFNLIGYIDTKNFIIFHTDSYIYKNFLDYNYYFYIDRLTDFIKYERIRDLKLKSIFIPDIFKNEINKDLINFDISNKSLKICFKEICAYSRLYINFNITIPLNPDLILNLKKEKKKFVNLKNKFNDLSTDKREDLFNFYMKEPGRIQELDINVNSSFKNNFTFLDLFNTYYNRAEKFNNTDIVNLIQAILRSFPESNEVFIPKNQICISHNGIVLEMFKYHIWKKDKLSKGYNFTNFNHPINTNRAINFLKMTPNFETFLYQLERIHLSKV